MGESVATSNGSLQLIIFIILMIVAIKWGSKIFIRIVTTFVTLLKTLLTRDSRQ